ncbi:ArgK/MeaB family GTPase [Oceanicella actignis]|uniref:LAO/AO transport system kinase n=1 Tax=Oceanicella actignis TaxID=1189325 RepID=A0A1M7U2E0_9RHOB|nr:ATP/GTP-binding protein [Oceanicella actignis]TYO84980.1 LAO/AO transport system kinase [Oceanicella actignis]SET86664.1 LAO/AO transport system kinase [Oceanicella actignis]SHN77242.1 LAO/AO transport system kinase [Oceanicella actignis]
MSAPQAEAGGAAALAALRAGGKAALARALARIEARPDAPDVTALLDAAHAAPAGHVIGLTGPPGVGKSTLVNALIGLWRARGLSVGVIAVDPSSRRSGGALLGDRTRIDSDPEDAGVFVRSMAARDRLGGLAELSYPAMTLMRAVFDRVLVETVGVGQSETEVADLADTVVLCVQPGSGDALQFMKSGVMEIPHFVLVTKADLGAPARRALADLKGALSLAPPRPDGWTPVALSCSALEGGGLDEAVDRIEARAAWLAADGGAALARLRAAHAMAWARSALRARFGTEGLAAAERLGLARAQDVGPFAAAASISGALRAALDSAGGGRKVDEP